MKTIVLDSTSKSLKGVLSGAVSTDQPEFIVAYADDSDDFFTGGNEGEFNGATEVTLVSAPGSSTERIIKSFAIYNKDSADVEVEVYTDDTTDQRTIFKITLNPGDTLTEDGVFDSDGKIKSAFSASATEIATEIDGVASASLADDDKIPFVDDTDSSLKTILWSAFKTALNAIYGTLSGGNSWSGVQDFTGRIDADSGISFDGGTNVFDSFIPDGTWTPSYTPETNSFDSITYSPETGGVYYKFNKLIIAPFRIITDSITKGTAADRVYLDGIPYPVDSNNFRTGHGFVTESSSFLSNHPTALVPRSNESKCNISFLDNTGSTLINVSDLATGSNSNNLIGVLIYITS